MKRSELIKEIEANSPNEQKDALKKFLSMCQTENQWRAFTVCHWKKTGPLSYQGERIWTFRNPEMFNLIKGV